MQLDIQPWCFSVRGFHDAATPEEAAQMSADKAPYDFIAQLLLCGETAYLHSAKGEFGTGARQQIVAFLRSIGAREMVWDKQGRGNRRVPLTGDTSE